MSAQFPDDSVQVGGDVDRIVVSVRVTGDDLEPDEVTQALGTAPTFAAKKGAVSGVGGREVVQRTGTWFIEFTGAPEEWTLEDAIQTLLRRLPSDVDVWRRLSTKYRLDVFCGLYLKQRNRGLVISPALLQQLADRHLELDLDVYYVGPESDLA